MCSRISASVILVVCALMAVTLYGANLSEQQAEAFTRKWAQVAQQATVGIQAQRSGGPRRTPFTEGEVNSWFAYRAQEMLPVGVTSPSLTIIGNGKLKAAATVDLEAIAKRRSTGRTLDPWSYLGGRVPVVLTGVLHTQDGVGRFEVEEAAVSGVPIPASVLQDMVSYYSRTVEDPAGIRLDGPFKLPARIRQIEVGQGQAVIVQ